MDQIIDELVYEVVLLIGFIFTMLKIGISKYLREHYGINEAIDKYVSVEKKRTPVKDFPIKAEGNVLQKVESHMKSKGFGIVKRFLIGSVKNQIKRKLFK